MTSIHKTNFMHRIQSASRVKLQRGRAVNFIAGFYIASILLLAAIGQEHRLYSSLVRDGLDVQYSQGYWSAVITAVLYFLCGLVLTWNLVGHLRGLYPASFILTLPQRSLMLQILCIMIWLAGGGGLFVGLDDYSYGDAPTNTLSRALVMPYALIGISILGFVIADVHSLIVVSSREQRALHHIEHLRVGKLRRMQLERTDEESFNLMREIHKSAKKRDVWSFLVWSTIMFLTFFLFSALVFSKIEGWSYFIGFYFCATSLLTIGYGQYVPSLPGSKAMSNTVIAAFGYMWHKLGDVLLKHIPSNLTPEPSQQVTTDLESQKPDEELSQTGKNEMQDSNANDNSGSSSDNHEIAKEGFLVNAMQGAVSDLHVNPKKKYSYTEWHILGETVGMQFNWLGTDSPIRFPIDEPAFFLRLYWNSLKDHLTSKHSQTRREPHMPHVDMLTSSAERSKIRTIDAIMQASGQQKL
ncbi:hypothetical protein POJ06DRAFT_284661 [Lipomyces tetrasporus]|uniref:Potassium channel domain-containing protein n=1 Tax=Lipomyces tetrasporus TaxID=54092 RepID=A0AAD7VUY3_9ASCO|nr:uncharacterized protein POJ06DRAFT_284661 [Lipomyces tetrasporus]KAJ8103687.1 hypothetical protein POJ06DRAFT_284661 [Lipomyces tetrasporus]